MANRIYRTPEAAVYVGLSAATLEKKRRVGGGPKFIHLEGRAVGYTLEDLDEWIESLRRQDVASTGREHNDSTEPHESPRS